MLTDRKNSFWLSLQFIITAIIYLLILKINIINFGDETFGVWIVIISIWNFSVNLDFGIGLTVVRHLPRIKTEGNDKLNGFLSTSFIVFIIAGFILFIVGYFASNLLYFSNSHIISTDRKGYFLTAFLIYSFSFIIQYLIIFYRSIFEGMSNFVVSSKFLILQNSLILIGTIAVWVFHLTLNYLASVYVISNVIVLALYIAAVRRNYSELKIKFKLYDRGSLKNIIAFSFSVQATNIFYSLIDVVVKYVIANFYYAGFAAIYEAARRCATAISGLFFSAFKYVMPKTSALTGTEEVRKFLKKDIMQYTRYGLLYSGLVFGILLLPMVYAIQVFFGRTEIVLTFIILAMPEAINNYGYCIYNFILGEGKVNFIALIQLINLVVTAIFVSIGFIIFKNPAGLFGYFCSVTTGNILMVFFIKKYYGIVLKEMFREIAIHKLIIFEGLLFVAVIIILNGIINNYLIFAALSLFSMLIFGRDIFVQLSLFSKEIRLLVGKGK